MGQIVRNAPAAGEISPEFYGRKDQIRTQTGVATLRNMLGMKSGGAQNRTGTVYHGTLRTATATGRLVKWIYSSTQRYKLEFSNLRIDVWLDGDPVTVTGTAITAITQASPAVLTSAAHGLEVGQRVYLSGIVGMTELNNRFYRVGTVPTANTFSIQYIGDGTAATTSVNSTSFTAWSSGGLAEGGYGIASTYTTANIPTLEFAQSAGTMVITHQSYAPRTLTRTSDTAWTLAIISNSPSTTYPTGLSATVGAAGTLTYKYAVTAVDERTGIESETGIAHVRTVNAITKANPPVVTVTATVANTYITGDEIQMGVTAGMTEVSGRRFHINVLSATTFELTGEDSTSYGTFSGTNSIYLTHIVLPSDAVPTTAAPNVVTLNATATANIRYNVYLELGGVFGWIGSTYALTFSDTGISPDTLNAPPIYREPFQGSTNWPKTCAFYQQRLVMGGSSRLPNFAFASFVGDYGNNTIHSPSNDRDSLTFSTAGYNDAIQHMTPLRKLIISTSGTEFVVQGGGEGGTLTPTETNVMPVTFNGSGALAPLQIDSNLLYIDRGHRIVDFHYSLEANDYLGEDRGLFARHLLDGHEIVAWAYQRVPNSIVWMVRDDGEVLTMTYIPDQKLFSFAHHDLYGGVVEDVCVVQEGSEDTAEDAVYFIVARTLEDDSTTRYVERLSNRLYSDIEDAVFLDSAATYDGTGTGTATLTGSGWTNATSLTCTFGTAQTNATTGNEVQLNGVDDDGEDFQLRCRIVGVTSTTVVTIIPHTDVPLTMQAVAQATGTWRMAVDNLTQLWHLEGQTVSIFGDSVVAASALNVTAYETQYTVADGEITLIGDQRLGLAHVGLPVTSDFWTLDLDPQLQRGSAASNAKLINVVDVRVSDSRSFWIGTSPPDDDDVDPVDGLYEPKIRNEEAYGPPALFTGICKVRTRSGWGRGGRVFLRVMEPAPVSILSVGQSGALFE